MNLNSQIDRVLRGLTSSIFSIRIASPGNVTEVVSVVFWDGLGGAAFSNWIERGNSRAEGKWQACCWLSTFPRPAGAVGIAERFPRAVERVENLFLVFPGFPRTVISTAFARLRFGRIAIMRSSAATVCSDRLIIRSVRRHIPRFQGRHRARACERSRCATVSLDAEGFAVDRVKWL
jgi:hypothetical protein